MRQRLGTLRRRDVFEVGRGEEEEEKKEKEKEDDDHDDEREGGWVVKEILLPRPAQSN